MRIALIASGGFDPSGRDRVTPALLWLVERLASRHEVVVYVLRYFDKPHTYSLLGATIRDLGSPRGPVAQYSTLVDAVRRDGPFDVLHGYLGLPSGLMAALTGRRLGVPSVVTLDSGELVGLPDIDYGLQLRTRHRLALAVTTRFAARLTVCSHYQEQLARTKNLQPAVIPIGVDTTRFARPANPPEKNAAGNPARARFRLLHVGSLNRVKDQATLLDAFARMARPDVHLDIVGEDTLGGAIQEHARRLNLDDRVSFLGWQPSGALAALYLRADLFVLSSRHEAANVAVLEAAACGVASVGTKVGYLADWSADRAVTVPPHDPQALATAITNLLADPPRRSRLAAAARAWTLSHNADWTAERFEQLYQELLHHKGHRSSTPPLPAP